MSDMFISAPNYPCDKKELAKIEEYLSRIDEFNKKISELDSKLIMVSHKCYHLEGAHFRDIHSVRDYVLRAFFQPSDNKEFSESFYSRKYAEIKWEGFIYKRNIPCQICGENRSIDRCHIIPARLGGTLSNENLLFLCPTHHRLFDRFMLSEAEWGVIDWESKSVESQRYAESVTLEKQKMFWNNINENNFNKIVSDGVLYGCDYDYINSIVLYIKGLFYKNIFSNKSSINKIIDKNIANIVQKVIALLIKHDVIVKIETPKGVKLAFSSIQENDLDRITRIITSEVN